MSSRITIVFFSIAWVLVYTIALAEPPLCPERVAGPNEPEELLMHESDFTLEKALESIKFLNTDFSKRIWGPGAVKDFGAWSGHYISYANSLRFIEGALLRNEALRLRSRSRLLSEQKPESKEAKASVKAFQEAKAKFCNFAENSLYID